MADDLPDDTALPADAIDAPADIAERIDVDALIKEAGLAGADFDPVASAKRLGLNDRQLKFGMAILQGLNQTEAAIAAGFAGTGATIRSAGSKCANSKKVRRFLEEARTAQANKPVEDMTNGEKRLMLSTIARNSGDNTRVRAILGHSQIEKEERERQEQFPYHDDPVQVLIEIAELDSDCFTIARGLARKHNLADQFEGAWQKHLTLQKAAPGIANGGTQAGAA